MRVVHYLNQFFGGIGAEEQAGMGLEARNGAVGPGKLLEQLLGEGAEVVMTLVCGDNYAVEHEEELVTSVLEKVREAGADLFVAGPCFEAGRYGVAAGALCVAVQSQLGISVITGMSDENPGVDLYRDALYIIDSGANAAKMREVLGKMANLGKKLVSKTTIGFPTDDGYLPRGLLRDQVVERGGHRGPGKAQRLRELSRRRASGCRRATSRRAWPDGSARRSAATKARAPRPSSGGTPPAGV